MAPLSTGGPISSRTFTKRGMEVALSAMPSSQRADVRELARKLDDRTSIGYYAAMDFLAVMGLYFVKTSTNID